MSRRQQHAILLWSREALEAVSCLLGTRTANTSNQTSVSGVKPSPFSLPLLPRLSMVMDVNNEVHDYRYYEKHGFRLLGFNTLLGVRLFLDSDESLSKGSPKQSIEIRP